jgi:hypothetical protein
MNAAEEAIVEAELAAALATIDELRAENARLQALPNCADRSCP